MENTKMRESLIGQIGMAAMLLMFLVGSVNAAECGGGTPCNCGDTLVADYTLTADLDCSSTTGPGLIIGASDITLDGAGHKITGNKSGTVCAGADQVSPAEHSGIVNNGDYDNVMIKNLEIENFCTGIALGSAAKSGKSVDYNTVTGCKIHDNGIGTGSSMITHGIHLVATNHCTITKNEIYSNQGTGDGCGDGGNGIFMHGLIGERGDYNTITRNKLYDNKKSGFFMKYKCMYYPISDNIATGNGEGGITLMCKKSNYNTIEGNDASGNDYWGIYIGGMNNTIRYNTVLNNKHYGINMGRSRESNNNELYENEVCGNEGMDIEVAPGCSGNHGSDNTCDTTKDYHDDGTTGCADSCGGSATTTTPTTSTTTTTTISTTTTSITATTTTTSADTSITTTTPSTTSSTTTISTSTTIAPSTIEAPSQFLIVSSPSEVAPPEEFKVEVKLSGKKVLGASFSLLFNPEVAKAIKVEEGSFYKNCPGTSFSAVPAGIDNTAGEIEFQDMCLGSSMSGKGVLAVIKFSVKSLGDPKINLKNVQLFDEEGDPMNENKIEVKNAVMQPEDVITTTSTTTSTSSSTINVPTTTMAARAPATNTAGSNSPGIVGQITGFSAGNGSLILGILVAVGIIFYLGYYQGKGNTSDREGRKGGLSLLK
ncbi:MAG: right-handed parallel beta-helix repeat-containing protein [Candidatus Altiarchaeota archaeon]|nr:right-handed parallel beta-helix repeat-containing protein [Candidatus Altiarchaeota archaeon]